MGAVSNLSGLDKVVNATAWIGQLGDGGLFAQEVVEQAPEGVLIIAPTGGNNAAFLGPGSANPEFNSVMIWPGGNPYQNGVTPDPTQAIYSVPNAFFSVGDWRRFAQRQVPQYWPKY